MEEAASLNVGNKLNLSFLRETGSLTGPDPVTQEGESRSRPSGKQTEVPDGTSPLLEAGSSITAVTRTEDQYL